MKKILVMLVALMLLGACAPTTTGSIEISDAWVRAPSETTGGAFMVIKNNGTEADRLVSASSKVAGMVQVHETTVVNDVMTMREVDGIDIPAGGEAKLAPGGYHVMLMNLKQPLKPGDKVSITLNFEKAGAVVVEAEVKAP